MLQPDLFVPKNRLEMPLYESSEVALELLAGSELIVVPVSAIAIMRTHFNRLPEWRSWPDGRGATINLTDTDGVDVPLATFSRGGNQESVFNTDGYVVHDDDRMIVTYGAHLGEESGIFWGISTQPLQELLADPLHTRLQNISTKSPSSLAYYNHMFRDIPS